MSEKKKCVRWGFTAFLVICAVLIFYDAFHQQGTIEGIVQKLLKVLSPVIWGLVIAYLLAPLETLCERLAMWVAKKIVRKKPVKEGKWLRAVGVILTWILVILIFYLLFAMMIPNLVDSITLLVKNAGTYYNEIYDWVESFLSNNQWLNSYDETKLQELYDSGVELLTSKVIPWAQQLATKLTDGVVNGMMGLINFVKNFLVAVIVSIYLLFSKECSIARTCKVLYATVKEDTAKLIMTGVRCVNRIFSGYVRGNLVDSAIIGVLCLIFCEITSMPYAPLVSVIVGVTNLIPFFGPIIGTIPAAFLILLVSPKKCLIFLIFILVLQQLDGNVIKPIILGDTTGISGMWVIIAIIIGGGLAGVLGMLLGVPIIACLRIFVIWLSNRRLEKKNLPTQAYEFVTRDIEKVEE